MGKANFRVSNNLMNPVLPALYSFIRQTEIKRLINQIATAQQKLLFKSVAVLSEYPGEGKTFLTAALALSYVNYVPGRVLIVNTVPQSRSGENLLKSVTGIHGYADDEDNDDESASAYRVDLLSARSDIQGKNSFGSDLQISSYIERFSIGYDIVLVDTCALSTKNSSLVDPVIIARSIDTSVLVVSPKSLYHSSARNIMNRLKRYGISPLGAVFNNGVTG